MLEVALSIVLALGLIVAGVLLLFMLALTIHDLFFD